MQLEFYNQIFFAVVVCKSFSPNVHINARSIPPTLGKMSNVTDPFKLVQEFTVCR